jgi:hypothetical protein
MISVIARLKLDGTPQLETLGEVVGGVSYKSTLLVRKNGCYILDSGFMPVGEYYKTSLETMKSIHDNKVQEVKDKLEEKQQIARTLSHNSQRLANKRLHRPSLRSYSQIQ